MHADDHDPPHVHVLGPGFDLLVYLADFSCEGSPAAARVAQEALDWIKANLAPLLKRWAEEHKP
jgi:hypothetical protein